jgi:hypothetical protein
MPAGVVPDDPDALPDGAGRPGRRQQTHAPYRDPTEGKLSSFSSNGSLLEDACFSSTVFATHR